MPGQQRQSTAQHRHFRADKPVNLFDVIASNDTFNAMTQSLTFWFMTAVLLLAAPVSFAAAPGPVAAFVGRHCIECHDAEVTKGGLNLAALSFDPADPDNFKKWQRIFERVRDGEMPPAKKPRPDAASLKEFLAGVEKPLLEADRADIAERGRVRSRRLTRAEYEHTLHDLLGIDLPLKELLPEDPATHGFQTVAAGQQLSHFQLARYLDVADLALKHAFERALRGDTPYKRFFAPKELEHNGRGNNRSPEFRAGRSISWPMMLQFYGRMYATRVPEDGWYRITLRGVQGINPGKDGAVWGTLRSGYCESSAPILYMIGLVEATARPRDMVFTAWIEKGHSLELKPNDFTLRRPPSGAKGGNVSYKGRDLEKEGYSGIAHSGIEMERIHPMGDRATVSRNLFGGRDLKSLQEQPRENLDALVVTFATRAFRRPVTDAQLAPYREIGRRALAEGQSFPEALRAAYRAILCSPRFLTFIETPGRLDDYAVATRLSYALWLSLPDAPLLQLAAEGKLARPDVLAQQVDRMLADPKSGRFIRSFTDQWLRLSEIDFTTPDPRQFPTFDPVVQESMVQETRAYVAELIRRDLGVTHLVDSDFAFLNGRLARHYRQEAPLQPGLGLQKISLPRGADQVRGGLLTHGAILKVTADGSATSPVIRGVFVNERILGLHIPPPPPNVPAIEPDIRGATSIRDQLEKHRASENCASCHRTIDPPGFALENFDPVGNWRTRYGGGKGAPVNPAGSTPAGAEFADLNAWRQLYARRGALLARGFAEQFLTYATGATIRFSDRAALENIVSATSKSGHGVRSILQAAIASPVFLQK
jgi:mono/diheme cytochrome c family protein